MVSGSRVVVLGDGLEWRRDTWGLVAMLVHTLGERMVVRFADRIVVDNAETTKLYANTHDCQCHRSQSAPSRLQSQRCI